MFGLELIKYKKKLKQDFSDCFTVLKDDLGNIPVAMQMDAYLNGAILSVIETYLYTQRVFKETSIALIVDNVFEELYRRDSVSVQIRIDKWLLESNELFRQGYQKAKKQGEHNLAIKWLTDYIQQNYEKATGLML